MGPTIILDKSALQGLSSTEVRFLLKHYSVVIPPILLIEILADLKKPEKEGQKLPAEKVQELARKIRTYDTYNNVWYKELCLLNLLGAHVPQSRQAIVRGQDAYTEAGERFEFFDSTAESLALYNWHEGNFTEAEKALAGRWREASQQIDLEAFKKRHQTDDIPKFKTIDEISVFLRSLIDANRHNMDFHKMAIDEILDDLYVDEAMKNKVFSRWFSEKGPPLPFFAHYAYYCFCMNFIFKFGVISGLTSTSVKAKSRIDLEYLYYLPFAAVFCSGDKFHQSLWPCALGPDQIFITREELKSDLAWLAQEWEGLSEDAKKDRARNYGSYPPENPDSLTYQIWQKLIEQKVLRPRGPGSGNRAAELTEAQQRQLIEQMKPYMDAMGKASQNRT